MADHGRHYGFAIDVFITAAVFMGGRVRGVVDRVPEGFAQRLRQRGVSGVEEAGGSFRQVTLDTTADEIEELAPVEKTDVTVFS